jgi:hypothetical protein
MKNRLIRAGAFLLVLALLGLGLAGCKKQQVPAEADAHAGHKHGARAVVTGEAAPVPAALRGAKCVAHNAPQELCFLCDAGLRDKGRLWCTEHNRYEDRCWECHPELQDKNRLWCAEHSLYEDECFLCRPERRAPASPSRSGRC